MPVADTAVAVAQEGGPNRRRFLRVAVVFPARYRRLGDDEFARDGDDVSITGSYVPFGSRTRGGSDRELLRELLARSESLDPVVLEFLVSLDAKLDRVTDLLSGASADADLARGTVRNLSGCGLLIATETPLAVGDVLDIEFDLPSTLHSRVQVPGVVRHVEADEGGHAAGIEFLGLSAEDEDRIISFTLRRERELRRLAL